jgi:aldose 1-epimerase
VDGSVPSGLRIGAGDLSAVIVPELGAGLAGFEKADQPIFRPWNGSDNPFDLANILLLPWSNRVSRGGFVHDGRFHPLAPNLDEPLPLHGNGFQCAWETMSSGPTYAEFGLRSAGPGPYLYEARARYSLSPDRLRMDLSITNWADLALPFGLGFHPWLLRTPRTRLIAEVSEVWLETREHLPDRLLPIADCPPWDFGPGRDLPRDWINNAFAWKRGVAEVDWPELDMQLRIAASSDLSWAIVYSPSAEASFFCFEPVTHPVDAYWLPGGGGANGMKVLAPGQSFSVWAEFAPSIRS